MRGVTRFGWGALFALTLALPACSFDTDSLYDDGSASGDAAGAGGEAASDTPVIGMAERREFAYLPGRPDPPHDETCLECAKTTCQHERTLCVADEQCYARLWCADVCRDPNCLSQCEAEALVAEIGCRADCNKLAGPNREFCLVDCDEPRERYEDLDICLDADCTEECNVGGNWGCAGKYEWQPLALESRMTLLFSLKNARPLGQLRRLGLPGADVTLLERDTTRTTDPRGLVTFEFQSNNLGAGLELAFEVDAPQSWPLPIRYNHGQPGVRSGRILLALGSTPPDPEGGLSRAVAVQVLDCLGSPAGDIEVRFGTGAGAGSNEQPEITGLSGAIGVKSLEGHDSVSMRAMRAGAEVGSATTPLEEGKMAWVILRPGWIADP